MNGFIFAGNYFVNMSEIEKTSFYGTSLTEQHAKHELKVNKYTPINRAELEPKRRRLLGPSEFWGEYHTQREALDVAFQRSSSSLHVFVYQNSLGFRKFIVSHPEIYWQMDKYKPPEERCSYEVIPDGAPCHLYFDLEFETDLNQLKNGARMTKTLIDIFCAYIAEHWDLPCKRSNVLSLDSTTDVKFSRHLVFRLKNVMFKNNKHVGRFVKTVCANIRQSLFVDIHSSSVNNILKNFSKEDVEELFVDTKKGRKLFVDGGVYTRNRHFRLYKSTKWGKNSHLTESSDSEYIPSTKYRDKELGTFLDSLISFLPDNRNLSLLEYQDNGSVDTTEYSKECLSQQIQTQLSLKSAESLYPQIDKFILDIVAPGKIRDIKVVMNNQKLMYNIADYRYCANIGRQHKSNGIYWVVDLQKKIAFQKCWDPDCAGFKSIPKQLPLEVHFQINDEMDSLLSSMPEPEVCPVTTNNPSPDIEDDDLDFELLNIQINQSKN
ncbi:DNA-directed primase/polymerase protein-like [Athalia rosae]|uniref:DNA-directed primase/polymerase protein-like n=1 Tax=Athalia rosae TaxID=37344 RepID=UPI002034A4F2|nr:DNA-directed primase/polymerase protein-like [Athalia rosae]XP_048515973.1 DNA-directed primase/polymerase protein-like [Athalia rosae]